ncbi:SNARE associated protein [Caldalkalibacillus thermarum TA2.A1]|nr:TVP38/TMEM64 family protein [Caldalkalibacillus thermarum]EGL83370.1 SNARE associated protein [Caldalkalibacillus thermarum TA2.A1]
MKKWLCLLSVYMLVLYFSYHYRQPLLDWINQGDLSQFPLMLFVAVFLAVFPVIPFTLFAGVMGAKYGVILGTLINWFGAVSSAAIFFFLARSAFGSYFGKAIQRFKKLDKLTDMVEKNAFLAVLFVRLVPIVPTPVVNIYAGISNMSFLSYFLATAIGQIPGMFVYALCGKQMFSSPSVLMWTLGGYLLFMLAVFGLYSLWYGGRLKVAVD